MSKHDHDHEHEHKESCCCGHERDHEHEHEHEHKESCCCGHHHEHDHDHEEGCCCGHDHEDGCGCGCGHDHGGEEKKGAWIPFALGAIPVLLSFLPLIPTPLRVVAAVAVYLYFGFDVYRSMLRGFRKGRIFTEFTLMCVATLGAFLIGEYADGGAVMYLYSLGETLSDGAYRRSKRNLSKLLEVTPEYATVLRDGGMVRVSPESVSVGEVIRVTVGERVPLDGRITEGGGLADTSSVTGEATPMDLYEGVLCPSGSVIVEGDVSLAVTHSYENSVATKLTRAVAEASRHKSASEKKISAFARIFTPLAFSVAILIALVGGLVSGRFAHWLHMGLVVLVISCPCSLVLSVPLTYFAGMGRGASRGVIFRGGEVMDAFCQLRGIALDKTGTLTESMLCFDGAEVAPSVDREEFLALSYAVLSHSSHAAARSFCLGFEGQGEALDVTHVENLSGRGIRCMVGDRVAIFGNAAFLGECGISAPHGDTTVIHGAMDGRYLGTLRFSAPLKEGTADAIHDLRSMGVTRIAVLSGDGEGAVRETCRQAGIGEYYSSLTPSEKLEILCRMQSEESEKNEKGAVAFCGDGLNDSAVVAGARIGIAMGKGGSALTVGEADAVIMDDDLRRIPEAIAIARRTSRIATQNIVLSLGIKLLILGVGVLMLIATGQRLPMEIAMVADVGAAILTVCNALRAARSGGRREE